MSKDTTATYLHMHHPHLADHFEDFTRPHTSPFFSSSSSTDLAASTSSPTLPPHPTTTTTTTTAPGPNGAPTTTTHTVTYGNSGSTTTTIPSFLPVEDVYVAPQFQPPNPEDEDDVVPDQHAAFGITRAMERRREGVWRDLGLEGLVRSGGGAGRGGGGRGGAVVRVREGGRLMGGRRGVVMLR